MKRVNMLLTKLKSPLLYSFLFVCLAFMACSKNPEEPEESCSMKIGLVAGNNQKGNAGEFLMDSIVFRVTDLSGNPVAGKEVALSVISGNGQLDQSNPATDNEGLASVKWKVGNGVDQIIKALINDEKGLKADAYVIANSDIIFNTKWVSGVDFYKNLSEKVDHDGKVLESNNFLIFSDASSDDNKVVFAKIAEEHLFDLKKSFAIASSGELGITDAAKETKIKIFTSSNVPYPGIWRGRENSGIIFPSVGAYGWVRMGLKHEIAHMVELLLIGPENFVGSGLPEWFTDGIAEYFSEYTCTCPAPITNVSQLNAWIASHVNPIYIIDYEDIGNTKGCEYYTMFGLVLKYLLDPEGFGKTCLNVKDMYKDLAVSKSFNLSFEKHMGISVDSLRENLYSMLTEYLSK